MKLLIVEDHPKIREMCIKYFSIKWHKIEWAIHWQQALELLKQYTYDVIILDINLPIMDGKTFLWAIREVNNNTPVIAATSNNMLEHKLEVYDIWVDDYIVKPYDFEELEARVNALYKRKDKIIDEIITIGNISIDIQKHLITLDGNEIKISHKEFLILEFLWKNKTHPKSKAEIWEYVWWIREWALNFNSTTLEMHISTLRKKLWKNIITTLKWVWYVMNES
jgi:DNA-binding response OmpR family regulator